MRATALTAAPSTPLPRADRRGRRPAAPASCFEALERRALMSVTVRADYSLDESGFFDDPARRAVLQAAVDAIDSRLADTLSAITPGGGNSWTLNFTHPATGQPHQVNNPTIPADTIVLYVGARSLGGALGIGGPNGWGAGGTQSWFDTIRARGESGALQSGNETDFAPAAAIVSFDQFANWHFGTTTTGLSGKHDFFSVAMHELGHALGVGTAQSWENLISGGRFTGAKSVASFGTSVPLSGDLGHWADGTRSGGAETALDPTILVGTRKNFTALDFAGLDDIGWEITSGPTPATGSIAGNVYNDLDADAAPKESGESGMSGWTVFLDADKDGVLDTGEKTATTDSAGNYRFTGVAAGTYRVREVLRSGFRRTSPSSGYHEFTLASGQAVTGKNFANTAKVLITGTVFNDLDGDAVKDSGEGGLANWRVFVDLDKDGVFDASEPNKLTTSTGGYSFSTLSAGSFRVRVVGQSGFRRTTPSSGYHEFTLSAGATASNKNFGQTRNVLITGTVFNDADGDRVRDSGEAGLSGWRVEIDADPEGDGTYAFTGKSTTTNSSGQFSFTALAAGRYRARIVQQTAFARTTPSTGYHSITLSAGQTRTGLLFGERRIA